VPGRSRRRRGRGELSVSSEINVTSMLDVAFTLLIIFVITAPMLQGGVEVNLPEADVKSVSTAEDMVNVSIQQDGSVFFEETELSIDDFESGFGQMAQAAGTKTVFLRGDQDSDWGVGVRVIATIVKAGVGVQVVAEPRAAGATP
jgi:biopolymer transport protein TolR